jgi:hypothetical protein
LAKSRHELAVMAVLDMTTCSMAVRIKFDLLSPIFFATAANFKSRSSGTFTVNVFIVFSNGNSYYQFVDMVIPGVIYVKILIWFSFMPGYSECLSDQINLLKINEINVKRRIIQGLKTTFLMAKSGFKERENRKKAIRLT